MKNGSYIAWAMKEPGGTLRERTYYRRIDAIKDFLGVSPILKYNLSKCPQWRFARKIGWKAVKVVVTEYKFQQNG